MNQEPVAAASQVTKKQSIWSYLKQVGPGMLVVGAFIGTGTITSVAVAGTNYGYDLLWAGVTVAILLTIILQEMSARLALATGQPLATTIRHRLGLLPAIIAILAIAFGNAIYSVGNENGVGLALGALFPAVPKVFWMVLVTFLYWLLLMTGRYNLYEKFITGIVALMGVAFVIDLLVVKPEVGAIVRGLTIPIIPEGSMMVVLALIGTTVVPYNLFLQSAGVIERGWHKDPLGNLSLMRVDTIFSIIVGGIVTASVAIVGAAVLHPLHISQGLEIKSAADIALTLKPLLGQAAFAFFCLGLFGAAVSSMPMASLSAAYVVTQSFGWPNNLKDWRFRAVFTVVAWVPVFFAAVTKNPIWTIIFAQSVNGIILPVAAAFVLYLINKKEVAGELKNNTLQNLLGLIAVGVALWLGLRMILTALGAM
ncbi:Nramp family divalent metal transporter [Gelria sp. Kuro-4]|jgi:NRAMP (natural resistance-associated macrophage protein)-like metal ion transporter|uniref:Nramp family divalent metal transporter n=1 Tax=Gelria sp. Kuro-4 TaxID=2796927 RepID=UPI001BEE3121|nr:Nramp family divalent metal transporter [Gelria sp. Kuro-4]BCV24181.1 manganese transporter [Gelria sp. Kuro-4]